MTDWITGAVAAAGAVAICMVAAGLILAWTHRRRTHTLHRQQALQHALTALTFYANPAIWRRETSTADDGRRTWNRSAAAADRGLVARKALERLSPTQES